MDIKIVFHPSGDWEGLYVNNKLEDEGHSIQLEDMVNAMNKYWVDIQGTNAFNYSTRDLGNEEGFDKDFSFPLKYEDIGNGRI